MYNNFSLLKDLVVSLVHKIKVVTICLKSLATTVKVEAIHNKIQHLKNQWVVCLVEVLIIKIAKSDGSQGRFFCKKG